MPAQTTDLFLLEDLENVARTSELAASDLGGRTGPAQIADRGVPEVVELIHGYERLFRDTELYEANEGTSIYNSGFRPFQSPAPFMFVRSGSISDWKFFLDDEDWLNLWTRHYGESAVHALAEELRRLPWRTRHD